MNKLTLISLSILLSTSAFASTELAIKEQPMEQVQTKMAQVKEQLQETMEAVQQEEKQLDSIATITALDSKFTTLVSALEATELNNLLGSEGPYTIFAPSNEAFDALPAGTLAYLLDPANIEALKEVISYHLVKGEVTTDQLAEQPIESESLEGETLSIAPTEDGLKVNNATIVTADIKASNGVIHMIDTVLMPEGLTNAKEVALNK